MARQRDFEVSVHSLTEVYPANQGPRTCRHGNTIVARASRKRCLYLLKARLIALAHRSKISSTVALLRATPNRRSRRRADSVGRTKHWSSWDHAILELFMMALRSD